MKLQIENQVRAGYITVFFLLFLSYISFFVATHKLNSYIETIKHTNLSINGLEALVSSVKDAETGVRGYIAVKDKRFLEVYDSSFSKANTAFISLKDLIKTDPIQQSHLDLLMSRINEKYALLDKGIVVFDKNGQQMNDSLKAIAYHGKQVMDTIRSLTNQMEARENHSLEDHTAKMGNILQALNIIIFTSMMIAVILGAYSLVTYNKENRAKKLSDGLATKYQTELEQRIEELNIANRELIRLKSIEKFAASGRIARQMAHEIRNPLTNIGLAAEQLRSDLSENEDMIIFFDMIDRNVKRINQLLSDLLSSTKFAQLQVENIHINNLLDEVLKEANDRLELKSVKLEKQYAPDLPMLAVDKERLKIAFLNVIVNAAEAMETGKGILQIKTENRDGRCCVRITDNGTGISQEFIGKLFEPYFTGKPKGTGLGLTSTQNIILNHKGSIDVESEAGKGSSFIIYLDFSEGY